MGNQAKRDSLVGAGFGATCRDAKPFLRRHYRVHNADRSCFLYGESLHQRQMVFIFGGLLVSVFTLGFYWLIFSAGWPRYLVIAVAMACFTLAVPVLCLLENRQKIVWALLMCVFLAGGIVRIRYAASVCDKGLFRPSTDRLARAEIVRRITELKREGPMLLGDCGGGVCRCGVRS